MNRIRVNGLIYLLVGGAITAAIIFVANMIYGSGNWNFIGYGFAIPGALGLVGLVQFVSGVPFGELASKWDSLKGWQRGILGTILVLLSLAIIFGGLILAATIMYE